MTGSSDRKYQTARNKEHVTTVATKRATEQHQKCDQQEHLRNELNVNCMEQNRPKSIPHNVTRTRSG